MKFFPTNPLLLASPSGKVAFAERRSSRGVSYAWADTTTARASRRCVRPWLSRYSTPSTRFVAAS